MVKPLSRTACVGIVAGATLYGAVVLGAIGGGARGLVDTGRAAASAIYEHYRPSSQMTRTRYDESGNFRFNSIGFKGFG